MSGTRSIIVVGGGLSGLAAAVSLGATGLRVCVLEQRPRAGGRASSFLDRESGEEVDNGQHLLIAGYRRTFHFLRITGAERLVAVQPFASYTFHHPEHGFGRLDLPRFPVPWHLVAGILRFRLLTLRDRLGVLRAGLSLRAAGGGAAGTIRSWLERQRQSQEAVRTFWEPLAMAIMNERIEVAAAGPFLRALATAFLGGAGGAAAVLPTVGLSRLFVDGARSFIDTHGGEIRCGADVTALRVQADRALGVTLRGGETIDGDGVVLAVPWRQAARLLPGIAGDRVPSSSPILSVHLWFERDFMPEPFTGLIGRRVQWVFNRRRFAPDSGTGGHLSAVISAAHEFVGLSNDALIAMALEDIRSAYPDCPETALRALVLREKRATYASGVETEQLRPGTATTIGNVALAGDWTATGLPATIEGAVISGERAALHLLREFGILHDAER